MNSIRPQRPGGRLIRGLLWTAAASLLLLLGLVAMLGLLYGLGIATGQISPERRRDVLILMTIYFRVVALKGLLPQLWLALALWPLVTRLAPATSKSRRGLAIGLAVSATAAHAVVGPFLLAANFENWPGLQMTNAYQLLATWLLMTSGVVLAAFLPRIWIPPLRPPRVD